MEKLQDNYLSDISGSIAKFEEFRKEKKVGIDPETKKLHIKILNELNRVEHTVWEEMVDSL